jgi:hypothetical protein
MLYLLRRDRIAPSSRVPHSLTSPLQHSAICLRKNEKGRWTGIVLRPAGLKIDKYKNSPAPVIKTSGMSARIASRFWVPGNGTYFLWPNGHTAVSIIGAGSSGRRVRSADYRLPLRVPLVWCIVSCAGLAGTLICTPPPSSTTKVAAVVAAFSASTLEP